MQAFSLKSNPDRLILEEGKPKPNPHHQFPQCGVSVYPIPQRKRRRRFFASLCIGDGLVRFLGCPAGFSDHADGSGRVELRSGIIPVLRGRLS